MQWWCPLYKIVRGYGMLLDPWGSGSYTQGYAVVNLNDEHASITHSSRKNNNRSPLWIMGSEEYYDQKRWLVGPTGWNKWWRCSHGRTGKGIPNRLQIIAFFRNFYLIWRHSGKEKVQKLVTCRRKSRLNLAILTCIWMGALIGGVRPSKSAILEGKVGFQT